MSTIFSRIRRPLPLVAAACAGLLAAGCASSGASEEEAQAATPKEPPVNLMVGLPPNVEEESRGTGTLTYEAAENGVIYLYDVNANQVVGNFNVQKDQVLRVDGQSGRATVSGNEVQLNSKLSPSRTYIAYLLPTTSNPNAAQPNMSGGAGFRIVPDNANNRGGNSN